MDLAAESRACERIGAFLETIGVKTPTIHWELTGLRVNVQERLYGRPASSLGAVSDDPRVAAFAKSFANAVLRMIILNGEFHGDPHPGNVFLIGERDVGFSISDRSELSPRVGAIKSSASCLQSPQRKRAMLPTSCCHGRGDVTPSFPPAAVKA
ncbi:MULTISPECIES: AarF/UbiB family protein [unclassified Blastomonas]|jgi:predicted unusual protein kinase regulating ubiquinone biosynthesis (AarF/ABC1/UbiB family)|uniref:AarF/UbiB family protein n=1 Tax=unclassified Blastomonas TaxID=2626550 RepID=UPI000B1E6254|nr:MULTISPECIES: AarF/UbiB family protein [unclassified Blastomonas]